MSTTISEHVYTAKALKTGGDIVLSLDEDSPGALTLDASAIPHVQGSLRCAVEDAMLLVDLDPRSGRRVLVSATRDGGTPRLFNLGLRNTRPNRADGNVELTLASDEAILQDFAQLVDDTGAWAFFTSLRGIVNYVLGKIGAALQPGTADANLTPYWSVTNLMPNPSVRGIVGNWVAGGSNATLAREAGHAAGSIPAGADVTTATLTSWTGNSGLGTGGAVANTASVVPYATAKPNTLYTVSCYVYTNTAKTLRMMCQVFGADGAVLDGGKVLKTQAVPAGAWTRIVATILTPPNTSRLGPFVYPDAAQQWTNGSTLRTTGWMLHEGDYPVPVPYFDGATPADANYTYAASGAAHASATTRTPKPGVERSPEALTWKAGVSAMDFLHPLLQATGLRLVCDETRKWWLRGDDYRAAGAQSWRWGVNIETADETLSREDDGWYDAAVYDYTWTDQNGVAQRRTDSFALVTPPTKVLRVEVRDTPYPGPGRAEAIVRRAQGRGRTVTVSGIPVWDERPGQLLSVILEGTPIQTGIAQSVSFDLAEDTVTVSSRTADTPAGAIDLLPGTINSLTGTINSL